MAHPPGIDTRARPVRATSGPSTRLDARIVFTMSYGASGFGIVAAVLGIVITMEHIDGPVEEIGHSVGAALVGTFLGILLSYGFIAPLVVTMEFMGHSESCFWDRFHWKTWPTGSTERGPFPTAVSGV